MQRAGEPLIRAIKTVVDDDTRRGQFLLNGSADFLTVPTISESLAGRAAFLELWPFTQGELHGTPDGFLEAAFADPDALLAGGRSELGPADYRQRSLRGEGSLRRRPWRRGPGVSGSRDYVRTVTQRDIKDLSGARRVRDLPRLLGPVGRPNSRRTGGGEPCTGQRISAAATPTDAYLGYLEMTYLMMLLPAWSRNLSSKIVHRPKVHITDSGLAAHLLGKNPDSLARPTDPARGPLLESFVANELHRQASWADEEVRLHHLRDRSGAEVDIVAEAADGRFVAVEVKAAPLVDRRDARHLEWLRKRAPRRFRLRRRPAHRRARLAPRRPPARTTRLTPLDHRTTQLREQGTTRSVVTHPATAVVAARTLVIPMSSPGRRGAHYEWWLERSCGPVSKPAMPVVVGCERRCDHSPAVTMLPLL